MPQRAWDAVDNRVPQPACPNARLGKGRLAPGQRTHLVDVLALPLIADVGAEGTVV